MELPIVHVKGSQVVFLNYAIFLFLKVAAKSVDPDEFHLGLQCLLKGAQWLSGRAFDSRPKGRGFEPHRRHCVVVLEQDTSILA